MTNNYKVSKDIDKIVGYNKETHEIYILNTLFEYAKDFKGATGMNFMPLTVEQIEEYNSLDYVVERMEDCGILEDAEQLALEQLSDEFDEINNLDSFVNQNEFDEQKNTYIDNHLETAVTTTKNDKATEQIEWSLGAFPFHDDGGIDDITEEDTKVLETAFDMAIDTYECVGGGRCFNSGVFDDTDFVSLNDELIEQIKEFEGIL